jgi:hypothetical protein
VRWAALLPDDRISLGAYKMRVYLGSDEMPSPSEQRRNRAGQFDGAPRAAASTAPRTDRMPPPLPAAASFAPPSNQGADEEWQVVPGGPAPPLPMPAASGGGFEILDEPSSRFELIDDDDDEIIELE